MDAVTLFNTLHALAAPAAAQVFTSTLASSYGEEEDVVKFVVIRVATDCKHYSEVVEYYSNRFTTRDEELLKLLDTSTTYTLPDFLSELAALPAVRLPKIRALRGDNEE